MTQYDPPPQRNEFDYIWRKWLNGLHRVVTNSIFVTPTFTGPVTINGGLNIVGAETMGYAVGSGGTVTQLTSKSTAVTLDKTAGRITMNNAALGAAATAEFRVNNSLVTATDTVLVTILAGTAAGGGAQYQIWCSEIDDGFFRVALKNNTGGSLSEAIAFNFTITKGSIT